jgi:hypothetical protein
LSNATVSIDRRTAANRTLRLYFWIDVVMVVGILVLVAYSIHLGSLVGPGVEMSFGIALGLMFIMAAVVAHTVDMTYRTWPLGRRIHPPVPRPISNAGLATALKVVVFVAAALAVAYILGSLIGV